MDFKKNKKTIYFFIIFLLLRLLIVFFVAYKGIDVSPIQDPIEYKQLGNNLISGNGFSISKEKPYLKDLLRGPVYPIFLGLSYLLDDKGYLAIIIQQLFVILVGYLLFKILSEYVSKKISFLAVTFFYLELQFWLLSLQTMSEAIYTLLTFLSFFILFFYQRNNNLQYWNVVLSAILSGLALLVRPAAILFIPWLFLVVIWRKKRRFKYAICFTGIIFLIIMPWLWRNYNLTNEILLSSSSSYNVVIGLGSNEDINIIQKGPEIFDNKGRRGVAIQGFTAEKYLSLKKLAQSTKERFSFEEIIIKQVVCSKKVWFDSKYPAIFGIVGFNIVDSKYDQVVRNIDNLIWWIVLVLCILGSFNLYKTREWFSLVILNGIILSTVFINLCVSYTRMRAPIMAIILLLSAIGLNILVINIKIFMKNRKQN